MSDSSSGNIGSLLLPLVLLALMLPVAVRDTGSGNSTDKTNAALVGISARGSGRAAELLCRFLGLEPGCNLDQASFSSLIVTVPDPVASQLNYTFDRYIDAILRATEAVHYRLDRFDLPWLDDSVAESKLTVQYAMDRLGVRHTKDDGQEPRPNRFTKEPGIVLLRNTNSLSSQPSVLVMFLVGETPTAGVHLLAFRDALEQLADLSKWDLRKSEENTEEPKTCDLRQGYSKRMVRVLGPSFSGSADSLKRVIKPWLCRFDDHLRPSVTLVSGSATAINADDLQLALGPAGSFNSTVRPTVSGLSEFLSEYVAAYRKTDGGFPQTILRLLRDRSGNGKVALLSEGNTGFGAGVKSQIGVKDIDGLQVIPLTFPLHISRLRAASEKVASGRTAQASVPDIRQRNLPIPVELGSERSVIPATSELEAPTAELVLAHILRTISQEQVRFVGILATDIRDRLFLAHEVRSHCPNVTLFTDVPDLLYLHSDANSDMRGALALSTYPLFGRNQIWTRAPGPVQFPTSGAQGVYNATLALLNQPNLMLEYNEPFERSASVEGSSDRLSKPPLWLSVVGRHELWPVKLLNGSSRELTAAKYLWSPSNTGTGTKAAAPMEAIGEKPGEEWLGSLMPEASRIALFVVVLCCVAPSIVLIRAVPLRRLIFRSRNRRVSQDERRHNAYVTPPLGVHHLEALDKLREFCESASNRSSAAVVQKESFVPIAVDRWIYALTLAAGLLSICLLVWGITALPVRALISLGISITEQLPTFTSFALASTALLVVLAGTVSAVVAPLLTRTEWRGQLSWGVVWQRGAFPIAFALMSVTMAVWLAGSWIVIPGGSRNEAATAIFLYARAVDLASGVSPLTPLLLVGIAGVLSVLCSLRRLAGVEHVVGSGVFVDVDSPSFAGVKTLEDRLRHQITCSSIELPVPSETLVGLLFILGFATYRLYSLSTLSFEEPAFDWAFRAMFAAVYLALLVIFLRFLFIWRDLRQLLRVLAVHPIAHWFADLRKAQREAFDATPISTSRFCQSAELAVTYANRTVHAATSVAPSESGGTAVRLHELVRSDDGALITRRDELRRCTEKVEQSLSLALSAEAKHEWHAAVTNRRAAEDILAKLTRIVAHVLEPHWRLTADDHSNRHHGRPSGDQTYLADIEDLADPSHQMPLAMSLASISVESGRSATSVSSPVASPSVSSSERSNPALEKSTTREAAEGEMLRDMGSRFLAARVLGVAHAAVWHMKNLLLFLIAGLLVMLLAVTSYPIQPRDLLLTFNWTVILTFVAATMIVFVQMERDSVLSALSGTVSGRVTWNREFAIRVLLFGILPILSLLGAQFPDALGRNLPWFDSVLSDLH